MPSNRPSSTLSPRSLRPALTALRAANATVAKAYPGETGDRQPVHTVYGGAHLFKADSASRMGAVALAALDEYAPDAATFARALGIEESFGLSSSEGLRFAETVRARVVDKLKREPVEDFRIDFEDGYGIRPDGEEDGHARSAAEQVAAGLASGTLPPFIGIRIKPMSKELHARSLRTLDLFVTALVKAARGRLPPNFVITVPKLMSAGHVAAVAGVCTVLERGLKLRRGSLALELMIETPQSILGPDGSSSLRRFVAAGGGRVTGAHFGTYDYTALCGITASWQHMRHQACDFAKHMMQVALAQTGVRLSDGATNIMPIPPHRAAEGRTLTSSERSANRDVVYHAWKLHFDDVRHSLVNGFYQGWDLHPAQLPMRYAAVYAFFLSSRPAATARLHNFVQKAAQATLVGDVFDDAATGQGLLNFFVRGLNSGALTLDEARETGLTVSELQGRSFMKILDARIGRIETRDKG
jgi:citrate lyase beta subunit